MGLSRPGLPLASSPCAPQLPCTPPAALLPPSCPAAPLPTPPPPPVPVAGGSGYILRWLLLHLLRHSFPFQKRGNGVALSLLLIHSVSMGTQGLQGQV